MLSFKTTQIFFCISLALLMTTFFQICSSTQSDNKKLRNEKDVEILQSGSVSKKLLGATTLPTMGTKESNTKPPPPPSEAPLPNPQTINECSSQWSNYFKGREGSDDETACCVQLKTCECFGVLCKDPKNEDLCKDIYHPESCTVDCAKGNWTMAECMALPRVARSFVATLNWMWILVIVAALMVVLVCVTICCVFRKKFTGKMSKEDKYGFISFGPMNVQSKVKWHGKSKKGGSSSKNRSSKKSRPRSSKKSKKSASKGKQSTSVKKAESTGGGGVPGGGVSQAPQKVGVIGGHAGKMTSTMKKRATMSDKGLLAKMKQ